MASMASHKSDILETERPVADVGVEKTSSFDSDDNVYATKLGNDQDGADMRRLGKKQQLNVRIGICTWEINAALMFIHCSETSTRCQSWA
jgi:hypothetical protein